MHVDAMIFMKEGVQESLVSTDILRFVLWIGSVLHPPLSSKIERVTSSHPVQG